MTAETFETIELDLSTLKDADLVVLVKRYLKDKLNPASYSVLKNATIDTLDGLVIDSIMNDVLLEIIKKRVANVQPD